MRMSLVLTTCFVLAACSGGTSSEPTTEDAVAALEGSSRSPAADATSDSEEAKPDCSSLPRPDDKPDNDLIGIDLGMSFDDAMRIGQCNKEGYKVTVEDDKSVTLPDGSHPRGIIDFRKDDLDRVTVVTMGLPGQEKVVALTRTKKFADGAEPTVEQMRADLTQKYGPLQVTGSGVSAGKAGMILGDNVLAQTFAPDGQPLPGNKVGDHGCANYFGQNDGLVQLDERCGFTKKVGVAPKYGNDALAGGFGIWIANQHALVMEARRVVATVQAMHQQRRNDEAKEAASSDRTPDL